MEKRIEIKLENGITLEISAAGQEARDESNLVQVKGTLSIPKGEDNRLLPQFVWGSKVNIINENLRKDWGYEKAGKAFRYRGTYLSGKKWKYVFEEMEKNLREEAQKIITAEEERVQALSDAEKD